MAYEKFLNSMQAEITVVLGMTNNVGDTRDIEIILDKFDTLQINLEEQDAN